MSSQGLSLTEAAAYLGIAERTLRARIKEGKVRADPDPQPDPGLTEMVAHVRELERRLEQYAGQIGFLTAQLQAAQEKIALLESPAPSSTAHSHNGPDSASQPASEGARAPDPADPVVDRAQSVPWWAFWRRLA